MLLLVGGGILGLLWGYELFLLRMRTYLHRSFKVPKRGSLRELLTAAAEHTRREKEKWAWDFLALLDRLSLGGALHFEGEEDLLLNRTFAKNIGLKGENMERVRMFEIPVFGKMLLQAIDSQERVQVPESGLAFSPFPLGRDCLLVLEDEEKKNQRFHTLRYFLTALWHEVQTPLTVLSGYMSTLEETLPSEREVFPRVMRQLKRLEATIREIQKLSLLLEEKEETISYGVFLSLLRRILEEKKDERKDLRIRLETEEGHDERALPLSYGEAFVLLSNLIANAFSFNVPSGEVRMATLPEDSRLLFLVENTASPPDIEFLSWFFDPTDTPPRGGSGKGVGLYLVQEVARRRGGEIRLRTQRDRVTFEVTIPWQKEN